jgi:osmotically-inducible protein OsmY
MKQIRIISAALLTALLVSVMGCTSTPQKAPQKESTGEYVDDSYITAKVKTAILNEPGLKSSEINVETFKGVVQLSGFVNSRSDIDRAVDVARSVKGVKSVKNDMRLK